MVVTEDEMARFWPGFFDRYEYAAYTGSVLAKTKTEKEFRSAVTFEAEGIIHIIPGKISNIFEVAEEAAMLLKGNENLIKVDGDFKYVRDGALDKAREELTEPLSGDRNTCDLQTYRELRSSTHEIDVEVIPKPMPTYGNNHSTIFTGQVDTNDTLSHSKKIAANG